MAEAGKPAMRFSIEEVQRFMDFFECKNQMEKYLRQKCADTLQPFAGVLELTPGCSPACNCGDLQKALREGAAEAELLSSEQWRAIVQQASELGVYAIRLTGGEPLTYPAFCEIYACLRDLGIAVTLDTNGFLLNEDNLEFLKRYGCRQVNIALYGTEPETYETIWGMKDGFDQVMHALRLLKAYAMPVKIIAHLNTVNIVQLEQMNRLAKDLCFPIDFSCCAFQGTRKGIPADNRYRLSPEDAAQATIRSFLLKNPQIDYLASCRYTLSKLAAPEGCSNAAAGFPCYAARSDFWITWDGEMLPCGMFRDEKLHESLLENSFADCWRRLSQAACERDCRCTECTECGMRVLCQSCPAACAAEAGSMHERPDYFCRMTRALVQLCREAVEESTSEKPLVSMIVPVYNVKPYLSRCIESIIRQNFTAWELILVDDGSSDGSGALCDSYAAQDNRIRVIHQQNRGVSAARNRGIEAAEADYITFCDSDDFLEPDFCRALYHKIRDHEDTLVAVNTWCGTEDRIRQLVIGVDYEDPEHITLKRARSNVLYAYIWNKIYVRRKLMEHHIRFDESLSYNEDCLFNDEYIRYCEDAAFIREPLHMYVSHEGGLSRKGMLAEGIDFQALRIEDQKLEKVIMTNP